MAQQQRSAVVAAAQAHGAAAARAAAAPFPAPPPPVGRHPVELDPADLATQMAAQAAVSAPASPPPRPGPVSPGAARAGVRAHDFVESRGPPRMRPEELPPAGGGHPPHRPDTAGLFPSSPFGNAAADVMYKTGVKEHERMVWSASLAAPQYGRRRNADLMSAGPGMRGGAPTAGGRPSSAAPPAASDATSYVTSYYSRPAGR
jgi:hypothetical protein